MNALLAVVQQVIRGYLQDHPILIWYDEGGTLADVFPAAVPEGVRFLLWEGSYLALRATVEREDPDFRQKWCIYVPEQAQDPSWLRDYELFGARVDLTLERLLAAEMGLRSNTAMRELLAGPRGSALNKRDERAVRKTVSGLIKLIHPDGEFANEDIIEEYLTLAMKMCRRVLIPAANARDLSAVPPDLLSGLDIAFFSDARECVLKAITT